jgi:hypothetical protein
LSPGCSSQQLQPHCGLAALHNTTIHHSVQCKINQWGLGFKSQLALCMLTLLKPQNNSKKIKANHYSKHYNLREGLLHPGNRHLCVASNPLNYGPGVAQVCSNSYPSIGDRC